MIIKSIMSAGTTQQSLSVSPLAPCAVAVCSFVHKHVCMHLYINVHTANRNKIIMDDAYF